MDSCVDILHLAEVDYLFIGLQCGFVSCQVIGPNIDCPEDVVVVAVDMHLDMIDCRVRWGGPHWRVGQKTLCC